jgi:hypothetical protein
MEARALVFFHPFVVFPGLCARPRRTFSSLPIVSWAHPSSFLAFLFQQENRVALFLGFVCIASISVGLLIRRLCIPVYVVALYPE